MQLCESAEQPSKMQPGVMILKDLIIGGMIYEGFTVIMGHGILAKKVETIDSQVKTLDTQLKTLVTASTESNQKLDKLLNQRWLLWR
mmetsp:Transcript_13608/g.28994  ORF Transcript_13608/g.28994 Transcript_13608/m.28994 type:complete len:87 (+) Transcript_13608:187-447(+)